MYEQRQKDKLLKLVNAGPDGNIQQLLLRQTVPKVLPSLKKFNQMMSLGDALKISANSRGHKKIHQEDLFVFHTTLVQLQKILDGLEASSDIKPLLTRVMDHNLSLIKLLFQYILQSERQKGKYLILRDTSPIWEHYQPLKDVFPFL